MTTLARALGEFVAEVRYETVPQPARAHASDLILDQLGCQIANARLPWTEAAVAAVRGVHPHEGPATVVVSGDRVLADDAALLNSVLGAGNEIDDVHMASMTHPGAVIIPTALAVGELVSATTTSIVESVIAGYEVMLRVARAAQPELMRVRHHHSPLAVGPFGAAAAAARLLGMDAAEITEAIAIAGSYSGGTMEYTRSGGSAKRLHTGIAAQAGVTSALLARAGLTGPKQVIEGERGFLEAFATRDKIDLVTLGLGETYMLEGTGFKNYFAMYPIHAAIQALEQCLEEEPRAHDIERIEVFAGRPAIANTTAIVHPTDPLGAQFSMRFALAVTALAGSDRLQHLDDRMLQDASLGDLADRIDVEYADEFGETQGARVRMTMRDGRAVMRTITAPLGSPGQPMSRDQVHAKFERLAAPVIGREQALQLAQLVREPGTAGATEVMALTVAPR